MVKAIIIAIIAITALISITASATYFAAMQERVPVSQCADKDQGLKAELTSSWISYINSTGLYEYGAQATITNAKQQNVTLTKLQATFTGEYRNQTWSRTFPMQDITLTAGGVASVTLYSGDTVTIDFDNQPIGGGSDAVTGDYLTLAMNQRNLGLIVMIEGNAPTGYFNIEAKPLQSTAPTAVELSGNTYSGPYEFPWPFNYHPQKYYRYQPLQRGVLGTEKFPALKLINGPSFSLVSLSTVQARTITVLGGSGPRVYSLTDDGFDFNADKWTSLGRDGDYVYFYGVEENYLAANGALYHVMNPTEVSSEKMLDPVEVAEEIIASKLGEDYTRSYFSNPSVGYNEGGGDLTHVVSFDYRIIVGNYSRLQPVSLDFDQNWKLSQSLNMPSVSNLQPFNVTESMARMIAVEAGVPKGPYGLQSGIWILGSGMGVGASAYEDKYVWYVYSWIDPPSSILRRDTYAEIDPVSGVVYTVGQGEFLGIGARAAALTAIGAGG